MAAVLPRPLPIWWPTTPPRTPPATAPSPEPSPSFFTAKVYPKDFERYEAVGAIGTVSKPFDPLKLSNQLIDFWNGHLQARQDNP